MPVLPDPKHEAMAREGWIFEWEPATYYIVARHPRGGVQSVLEIRNPDYRYLGPMIEDALNFNGFK